MKAARTARAVRDEDHAKDVKAKIEANAVMVKVRAGEGGRLFGAVTTAEIADAITAVSGEKVDRRTIVVANPIKTLGAHEVSVKLHDEVSATVALNVVPA
jgi:large subunit ribosomal protein L9